MTNDELRRKSEIRMTKPPNRPPGAPLAFGLRVSFVIGHSTVEGFPGALRLAASAFPKKTRAPEKRQLTWGATAPPATAHKKRRDNREEGPSRGGPPPPPCRGSPRGVFFFLWAPFFFGKSR